MKQIDDFVNNGFTTIDNIYTVDEVGNLLKLINQTRSDKDTFRKSADLFAIRQFLNEVPETINVIFNIMLMKPLLLHSSGRTVNNLQRRVIHIELSNVDLPKELNWSERINLN